MKARILGSRRPDKSSMPSGRLLRGGFERMIASTAFGSRAEHIEARIEHMDMAPEAVLKEVGLPFDFPSTARRARPRFQSAPS
jgi:hypothetical protein